MQNQNYWNDSYAATGYSEDCWVVNGQTNNDDLSSFSLTSGVDSVNGPYDEFLTYSTTPTTSIIETTSEVMPRSITSSKILPCLDPRAEITHGVNESTDELLELNPRKFSGYRSKQKNGRSLSNSQNFSSELFNRTSFSSDLSRPKIEERRCSLPTDNLGIRRLLGTTIDLTHDSHDSDTSEGNSYSSCCDIALENSNDSLSKQSSWSYCYAPNRKRPASSISSERGIDLLINKLFTDDQKKRYLSIKRKKAQKMEEKKERLKCMGIDASYRTFMEDGMSTSQNAVKFENKDELEADVLSPKHSGEVTLFQNRDVSRTVDSPSVDSDANSRLSNFFTELSAPSQSLVLNDANQSDMSVDEEASSTRIVTENVPFEADVASRSFEMIIETTKEQFCTVVEMDTDTNISAGNFSNDEISNSLEKIFTGSNATDDSTVYNMKQEPSHEMDFDFESEKLALPHEECIDISTKEADEAEVIIEAAIEDSESLDAETPLYEKGISPNSESRTCMEVVASNNSPECLSGLDSHVEHHSPITNFTSSIEESDTIKAFTDEKEITDPLVEYTVYSSDLESHVEHHSTISDFPANADESDSKAFTVEKKITNPSVEYSVCSSDLESHVEQHSSLSDFPANGEESDSRAFTDKKEITNPVKYAVDSIGLESHVEHHSSISDFPANTEESDSKLFADEKEVTNPSVEYSTCASGFESHVEHHSSISDFPANDEESDSKLFTDEKEITNPSVEYSACSSGFESHVEQHSTISDFSGNVEESDTIKSFTEVKEITDPPVEYTVSLESDMNVPECEETADPIHYSKCLDAESDSKDKMVTFVNIADSEVYDDKVSLEENTTQNSPINFIEIQVNELYCEEQKEPFASVDHPDSSESKLNLEGKNKMIDTITSNSETCANYISLEDSEIVSEAYLHALKANSNLTHNEMVDTPVTECKIQNSYNLSDENRMSCISDNHAEEQYMEVNNMSDNIAGSETCHVSDNISNPEEQYMETNNMSYSIADSETCANYISLEDNKDIVAVAYLQALRGNSDSEILDTPVTECKIQNSNLSDEKGISCISDNHAEEQYNEVNNMSDNIADSETCTNYISLEDNKDIVAVAYLQALRGNSDFTDSEILDIPVNECKIENSNNLSDENRISNPEEEQSMEINISDSIADCFHEKYLEEGTCNVQKDSNSGITLPEENSHSLNEQDKMLQYSHNMESNCVKIISKAKKSFGSKALRSPQEEKMQLDDIDTDAIESCDIPSEVKSPIDEQGSINETVSTRIFINDEIECTLVKTVDDQDIVEQGTTVNVPEDTLAIKPCQKSKKSFMQKTISNSVHRKETARKSVGGSHPDSSHHIIRDCSDTSSDDDSDSTLPKRRKLIDYLRQVTSGADISSASALKTSYSPQTSVTKTAMKTFVKPFTVAKKSVSQKAAYKSILQAYFGVKTAMKTVNKSVNQRVQKENIIENDGSAIVVSLTNQNDAELSVEELSADDSKNSPESWSPLKDLMPLKSVCRCSADMVPCLCNGEKLQVTCEAEDSIDGQAFPCSKDVNQQFLLTPSSKTKHKVLCDTHLWRLQQHHCCPKCGVFCTQGSFLLCSFAHLVKGGRESHFFHPDCLLVPGVGLPPSCPHCCRFSDFKNVHLSLSENSEAQNSSPDIPGNSDVQNITSDLENYSIFMQTVNTESEKLVNGGFGTVSQKQELQSMVMAIASEKSLHLRPSGKCLFNPIKNGDVKKVLQLIVNGVNPNHKFKTHKNNTPLHIGAYYGFPGIVHVLLQYGALIDAVNDDLETPLIMAVERNQLTVVRYLTFAGAQIDVKNENGLTAFHVASKNGSKEIAEFLFNTGDFNVNIQDEGGWTPLVWACENNYSDYIKWLLELGADPNVRDNEENTALHWAACTGDSEILIMLLDSGCNLTFVNQRGDSALHIAARKDNFTCVKLLLKRGAPIDCKNKEGETPILCCDNGSKSLRILKRHLSKALRMEKISLLQNVVYRDVSRGSEAYPIQAVNEVDEEEFIMDFRYITSNCYSPDLRIVSTVDSMQVCYCRDNCSSRDCSCARISKCWYDMSGRLLSEFDLNDPPTIFECNKTCHCPKTCINRIVQKGLKIPLQLFRTLNIGWGVRTLKEMQKGTFVCEYIGEVLAGNEIAERADDSYLFDLESKTGDICMDGRFYGNVARFINHSCEPNLVSVRVFIEHQDLNFPRIAFFTLRNVGAFEELCFDYGLEFWIAKSQTTLCTCNTSSCKYSKDSIDDTLQSYADEKERELIAGLDT